MIRDRDYEFIRQLVYRRSRINLGPDKRELVTARLNKRLRATNIASISDYCRYLQDQPDEEELAHLIDVISTNHTYFFREIEHFDFLRGFVLPEMVRRRATERWPFCHLWSAACSSGEEPYSIAISMAEYLQKNRCDWPWRIEATDISHRVLLKARVGVYREDALERVPRDSLLAYFQKGFGPQAGNYRIKPQLAEMITFRQLNLLESELPGNDPFHVIFCRNVMIYFDRPTQEELVHRLSRRLVPGGYLFVGHSESLTAIHHGLEMVRPAIYRRPLA
jgi:chemotaxis protein methyltransferase CheR